MRGIGSSQRRTTMNAKAAAATAESAAIAAYGTQAAAPNAAIDAAGATPKAIEKIERLMPVTVPTGAPNRMAYFAAAWFRTVRVVAERT